ncbi:MAG: DUF116 domain-containing protein [Archaeoglobales archaeon]|nr:DUF116 domain-containing protein [Archaeoglobales archaeon]
MERLVSKILAVGADVSTRNALKKVLNFLGEDENSVDLVYLAVKNVAFRMDWERCVVKKRAVFLPQCLRSSEKCEAKLSEKGYLCKKCGNCVVGEIVEYAESLGYKHIYIVPGGSLVLRILKSIECEAVLGVACVPELCEALERIKIPAQVVPLTKAGCINTEVDVKKVKEILGAGLSEKED